MRNLIAVAAILALAGVVSAANITMTGPVDPFAAGMADRYEFSVANNPGDTSNVTAIEISVESIGANDVIHQISVGAEVKTGFPPTLTAYKYADTVVNTAGAGTIVQEFDTAMLTDAFSLTVATVEDIAGLTYNVDYPLPGFAATGPVSTFLDAKDTSGFGEGFTFIGATQGAGVADWGTVFQLVVPKGLADSTTDGVSVSIKVTQLGGTGDTILTETIGVPEPATMGLLSLGALVLRRRR